jgi:hypothetical protein
MFDQSIHRTYGLITGKDYSERSLRFDPHADKPSELLNAVQRSDNAAILASIKNTCASARIASWSDLIIASKIDCTVLVLIPFNTPLKSYGDEH